MKKLPFDIEKAKAGAKIVTRKGDTYRFLCDSLEGSQPLGGLINNDFERHNLDGTFYGGRENQESINDLFILSEPTYKPFTRETVPSDKWFINHHGDRLKITEAYLNDCLLGRTSCTYNEVLNQFKFEDGSPCGIEE